MVKMSATKYSDKIYTIRKSDEIDQKLDYLSNKLSINNSSLFRMGLCLLYDQYSKGD